MASDTVLRFGRSMVWAGLAIAQPPLSAGCAAPPPAAEPAAPRPRFEIGTIVPADLLREANRGRSIVGNDGRFVIPAGTRRAWIDVGAHLLETTRTEWERSEDMTLLAIEPLAECWRAWPDNPRLIALPVAISTERGWMDFHVNAENVTSSLLESAEGSPIGSMTRTVEVRKVPVLRLEDVLEMIPPGIAVEYLKTDVQGLDLQVLQSAGDLLRRVESVKAEVINERFYEGTDEIRPGTEAEFVAYMEGKGFLFERDSEVSPERAWLDKHFVNPQRVGFFERARRRLRALWP